jgi:hypothetical protein
MHNVEGCAGLAAQSLMQEAGRMDDITYFGLDVHKATVCVAVARADAMVRCLSQNGWQGSVTAAVG